MSVGVVEKLTNGQDHRPSLKYDSTDSSDSGVGGDCNAWSPCSSVSYSPPPTLTDEEQAESPSPSPTSHTDATPNTRVNCMAPNDASRVAHKNTAVGSFMGRCVLGAEAPSLAAPILDSPSVKGKPPDEHLRILSLRSPRIARELPKGRTTKSSTRGDIKKNPCINGQADILKLSLSEAATRKDRKTGSPRNNNRRKYEAKTCNNNLSIRNNNNMSDILSKEPLARLPSESSCSGESTSSGTGSCSSSESLTFSSALKVRFPAPTKKKDLGDSCRWRGCAVVLDQTSSLLEHIQAVHVEGQLEAESFRCLWVGCKVFDRASCSVSWLERHVLTHGGNKPFKCIVDGCGQRFTSQGALERHVNQHFSSPSAPPPRTQGQPSPIKLMRKNGRKLRYRKKPFSARNFDFFDVSCMEQIKWSLIQVSQFQNQSMCSDSIKFTPQVIGKRKTLDGVQEALVSWTPKEMLPDEWVPFSEVKPRCIPLSGLSSSMKVKAFECCFAKGEETRNKRKRSTLPQSKFVI